MYSWMSLKSELCSALGRHTEVIKWKGWGARWNNWEPEVNILDRRMLRKFNRPPMSPSPPRPEMGMPAEMKSKRRCAKRAVQEILACAEQECD